MIRKSALFTIIGLICLIGGIVLFPSAGHALSGMESAYIAGSTRPGEGFMGSGIGAAQEIVVDTGVPNEYYETLYAAFLGSENGSALYVVMILLFTVFLGIHLINAADIVVETISGLSSDIPDLTRSAIIGAISGAYSLGKNILGTANHLNNAIRSKADDYSNKSDKKSQSTPLSKFEQGVDKSARSVGNIIDKGAQTAGNAVEKAGSSVGKGLMKGGSALSSTGIGAIIGIPLIVAGAAVTAASKATGIGIKAAGKAAKYTAIASGKATRHSIRIARKTAQKVKNRMKPTPATPSPRHKRKKYRRNG